MFEKLKDGANKLKAKIGGDDLDEKLVEVVSEQNWQASTQQLHEVANAAYNYQKWQRINEFIWEKLKKSKSWKKILKTFNLIEFLLKNGPPSIITNFKYDIYQLRTFESYSNYVEGLDKGEPIRERAKVVVNLLSNEELLEEERVKAKNIREKMSNVIGGAAYRQNSNNGYGGSGYGSNSGHNSKYDNYDNKKKNESNTYNYGNTLGAFGDYAYNKSTLDKYKDAKNDKSTTEQKKEERKPDIVAQTKKPFEKIASKLSKPGERKEPEPARLTAPQVSSSISAPKTNTGPAIDIFEFESTPTPQVQTQTQPFNFTQTQKTQPQPQPQLQPLVQPQPQTQTQPQPQLIPQAVQAPLVNQGYNQPPQVPQGQNLYYQPQAPNQYVNPQAPNPYNPQPPQMGMAQGQYGQFNPYGQPNPYQQPYQQPNQPQYYQQPYNQQVPQPYGGQPYGGQPYNQPYAPPPQNAYQQPKPVTLNQGITLNNPVPKKQQDFGTFSSSATTAQNVNWLSSTQKGLIDFSDFGAEIKKDPPKAAKQEISNNIQIDNWSW